MLTISLQNFRMEKQIVDEEIVSAEKELFESPAFLESMEISSKISDLSQEIRQMITEKCRDMGFDNSFEASNTTHEDVNRKLKEMKDYLREIEYADAQLNEKRNRLQESEVSYDSCHDLEAKLENQRKEIATLENEVMIVLI
jgi:predicted nuclease with TOPRIM domain